MKYAIFFLSLCITIFSFFEKSKSTYFLLLFWIFLNSIMMCLAYLFKQPKLIINKINKSKKSIFNIILTIILALINLPWLLFTWFIWWIQYFISNENALNEIGETNISISRFPIGLNLSKYDLVIDLTAEFPAIQNHSHLYLFPNLDGVKLSNIEGINKIDLTKNQKILIHCAQGHGRSATFASILIAKKTGISILDAYELIKKYRPMAKISSDQLKQLQKMN